MGYEGRTIVREMPVPRSFTQVLAYGLVWLGVTFAQETPSTPEPAVLPNAPIFLDSPQSPSLPVIVPTPPFSTPDPIASPLIEPTPAEIIFRLSMFLASPNITNQRRFSNQFISVAPWRFPNAEAAGLQITSGLTFELGYQFETVPVGIVGRISVAGEESEIAYKNDDPLYDTYQDNPKLKQRRKSAFMNSRVLARDTLNVGQWNGLQAQQGTPDLFGYSIVLSRLSITNLDLLAQSPYFNIERTSFRVWGGVRRTVFFMDDNAIGRGIEQLGSTSFTGWGPLIGTRLNWNFDRDASSGFYLQTEGALLNGKSTQILSEAFTTPYPELFTYSKERENRTVPNFGFEIGFFSFAGLTTSTKVHLAYQFNQWWDIGKIGNSNVNVHTHGIIMRFEINY